MSEISSGLVAVAWQVRNGWPSCDLHRTLKSATEDRDMLQKRADLAGNLMAYRVEPLVRLSDAEAIIAELARERSVLQKICARRSDCLEAAGLHSDCTIDEAKGLRAEAERQAERITELERKCNEESAGWAACHAQLEDSCRDLSMAEQRIAALSAALAKASQGLILAYTELRRAFFGHPVSSDVIHSTMQTISAIAQLDGAQDGEEGAAP